MRRSRRATTASTLDEFHVDSRFSTFTVKKRPIGVIPNEFIVSARVQVQRMMPVWLAKARWLVLRGSKTPVLAVHRHIGAGSVVLDDHPLKVMILGTDTGVQVMGERGMVLTSSRVRRNDTWVIAFETSAQRQRMYELVKLWIELGAFLQRLTDFESIVKSNSSVVYRCSEVPIAAGDVSTDTDERLTHRQHQHRRHTTASNSVSYDALSDGIAMPPRQFALKRMSKAKCTTEVEMTQRILAIESLQPYLARYHYMYETRQDSAVTIVMQFYRGGSLADRIRAIGPLHEKVAKSVLSSLCCALYSLHQHGILHLDVKAANVLFDSDSPRTFSNLKLVDFGNSALHRRRRRPRRTTTLGPTSSDDGDIDGDDDELSGDDAKARQRIAMGTYGCMAPERFDGCYGPEADVYGAGVVLFHMVVGEPPFPGSDPYQVMVKNMQGDVSFASPQWRRVSPQLLHLTQRMLDKDPRTRITIPEVLKLRWLFQNLSTHELHQSAQQAPAAVAPLPPTGADEDDVALESKARPHKPPSASTGVRSRGVSTSACTYSSVDYFARSIPRSAKYA